MVLRCIPALIVLCLVTLFSFAQAPAPRSCGQHEVTTRLKQQNPNAAQEEAAFEQSIRHWVQDNSASRQGKVVVTIPVVVHVVYNTTAQNISDAQILSQIDVLNEDFRKLNSDTGDTRSVFKPFMADSEIEFCLAVRDPNGNPTTGITRTPTSVTSFNTDDNMKSASTGGISPWPRAQYLNIWVCNLSGGVGGYAYLPSGGLPPSSVDGVVVAYDVFGRVGTLVNGYHLGRSCTHEVGHYLGLYHTFDDDGNCTGGSSGTCATAGDRVCDTPADNSPSYGSGSCPTTQNSCLDTPTDYPDQIENYMDYSYDFCKSMFSLGQKSRMLSVLNLYRSSLYASSNLACVPFNSPPVANFTADYTNVCPGTTISFSDLSTGIPTAWSWSFPGGSPSSSTSQNPSVTYGTTGTYSVTLTATNSFGSDAEVKTGFITVGYAGTAVVFSENFESGSFNTKGWTVSNPDNSNTWSVATVAGNTPGTRAAKMSLYGYASQDARDAIITPVLDFSNKTDMELAFEHAHRRRSSSYSDSLVIYISINGGATYPTRLLARAETGAGTLATGSLYGNAAFTPAIADDWCFSGTIGASCFTIDLSAYDGMSNIRLKFETVNDNGNNIYLDNIMIAGGCVPANQPPVADFMGNPTTLVAGGSVNFTDLSANTPTSWSWSFPGGTPASSTVANPTGIVYNTPGSYNVTLTATNTFGSDVETKTAYITVLQQGTGSGCDTMFNIDDTDTLALYRAPSPQTGYVSGHNSYGDSSKADYFVNTATGTITGGLFYFGVAKYANANSSITAKIWSNNAGQPGTVLGSENVTIASIAADVAGGNLTYVNFSPPIAVTGNFFMGISFRYASGDTIALVTNTIGSTVPATAWEQWNTGAWFRYDNQNAWQVSLSHAIFPVLCTGSTCPSITVSLQSSAEHCGQDDGTASATASGGTAPYAYTWSDGQSGPNASGLAAGNYSVTASDANGCTGTASLTVINIPGPAASITNIISPSCGGSNGAATASATGGTGPYNYSWSNGTSTATASQLQGGAFTVTATDLFGCIATASVTLTAAAGPSASISSTNINCFGDATGTATATISGGTAPYSYFWSNGSSGTNINSLAAGAYSLTVYDNNQCSATSSFTVTQPAAVTVNISKTVAACNGNDGTASVTAGGGTPPYTYSWSTGQTTQSIAGLSAGNYSITVKDSKNCQKTSAFNIGNSGAPVVNSVIDNVSCFGSNDGDIDITLSGGNSPYTISWSDGPAIEDRTAIVAGTYNLTVTDNSGCETTETFVVTQPALLQANVTGTDPFCGNNNGQASVSPLGGIGPYIYLWSNGKSSGINKNLGAGTYHVTITDANGCTASASHTLTGTAAVDVSFTNVNNALCGQQDGSVTASVVSGLAPFTYIWSNGTGLPSIGGLTGGVYIVIVIDANNCRDTASVIIADDGNPAITPLLSQVSCNGLDDGNAILNTQGGTAPYIYTLNGGIGQTNSQFDNLAPGNYIAVTQDVNGCTDSETFTITEPNTLLVSISSTPASGAGSNNGSAFAAVTGGSSPYSYEWSTGATTASLNNLAGGAYDVTITDANGCATTEGFTIGVINSVNEASYPNVSIFPNPNNGSFVMQLENFTVASPTTITIYDVMGKILYKQKVLNTGGLASHDIYLRGVSDGMYFIKIAATDAVHIKPFVVDRD